MRYSPSKYTRATRAGVACMLFALPCHSKATAENSNMSIPATVSAALLKKRDPFSFMSIISTPENNSFVISFCLFYHKKAALAMFLRLFAFNQ
jgi:hypothetical protein